MIDAAITMIRPLPLLFAPLRRLLCVMRFARAMLIDAVSLMSLR